MAKTRSRQQLLDDARAIWQAGVDAVRSDVLVADQVNVSGSTLELGEASFDLSAIHCIAVVGGGKAGTGMAIGLERELGPKLLDEKQVRGLVNVPADCVDSSLTHVRLCAARPAGHNEPTQAGVDGTRAILELVGSLTKDDLCICLLSGGGSALLPAPVHGISLQNKQELTRFLASAGANIQELNTVRKQLSAIKGGGLARACTAGNLVTLIISDVLGDPLDIIASGPTVPSNSSPQQALAVLEKFNAEGHLPEEIGDFLRSSRVSESAANADTNVINQVIGNNAVAVDAAGMEAERRGYSHAMLAATELEGAAEQVGRDLLAMAERMRAESGPDCLITGGEPTSTLR